MYIKKLYSTRREAENHQKALDVPDLETAENESATADVKRAETKAKQQAKVKLPKCGKRNLCMGNTLLELKRHVNCHSTHKWLIDAGLKAETKGSLVAAQDQSLAMRSHQHRFMKNVQNVQPVCNTFEETTEHIICGFPELAKSEYIHRHNKAAVYIHWKISKKLQH